jgi:hypothetical protein
VLRTQVLNGSGVSRDAAIFSEQLLRAGVAEFRFDVIDRGNFERFDVEEPFMTVYTLSPDDALRLAAGLGLSAEDVFMAEKTDNPLGLDVTIVLGSRKTPVLPAVGTNTRTPSKTE